MHLLDFTFPTPAENLACDEALLDLFEERGGDELLRFWEPDNYFVVVGYANHVEREVNVGACEAEGIPILRRCSGGGTVLQGPGCLNYSLILKIEEGGPLSSITSANRFIMERNREAVEAEVGSQKSEVREQRTEGGIEIRGHTDLALDPRPSTLSTSLKFSGNAQRRKKNFLLFHGTFLLSFDIALIDKFLRMPSKEPDYRKGRSHADFLTNVDLKAEAVKRSLAKVWNARATGRRDAGGPRAEVALHDAIALLARDKYVTNEWNFKF